MSSDVLGKIAFVVIVAIFHMYVLNHFEKLLTQIVWGPKSWTRTPSSTECRDAFPLPTSCYGFPSNYAEVGTIVFVLLGVWKIVPFSVSALCIVLINLQRVVWKKNTMWQVFAGNLVGLLYVALYVVTWNVHPFFSLLTCLVSVAVLTFASVTIISREHESNPLPSWVHPSMYPLIDKKRKDTSTLSRMLSFGGLVLADCGYGYLRWPELEAVLDNMMAGLNKRPDIVVGIKTGGGILAGYVANKLMVPLDFMRTKRAVYNCTTNTEKSVNLLKDVINVETRTKQKFQLCEKPIHDMKDKHVLLIDETSYSGGTLFSSKEMLMMLGAKRVDTFVVAGFQDKTDNKIDYTATRGVAAWPWSFDN
jgi:adenine/guanine phosphoribosyltransferase-like PRPP-binding protein